MKEVINAWNKDFEKAKASQNFKAIWSARDKLICLLNDWMGWGPKYLRHTQRSHWMKIWRKWSKVYNEATSACCRISAF